MTYKVISSGSHGNAILYDSILIDIGIPFNKIKPYINDIGLVLLTHEHLDHININTLKNLQFERPSLRIGCCNWMLDYVEGLKNIDVFEVGKYYNYDNFTISPVLLYHDIPNCGYRISIDGFQIFHATDTAHLEGIEAHNYDLYAIEHNYNEDTINEIIDYKKKNGRFCHEIGAVNTHLSEQQAGNFIFNNVDPNHKYEVLMLHESKNLTK